LPEPLQSAEIIRTELTRRWPIAPLCPLMLDDEPEPPLAVVDPALVEPAVVALPVVPVLPPLADPLMLSELVPVISTRCPTCFFRSAESPSSTYDVPAPDAIELEPEPDPLVAEPDVPDVPAVEPEPLVPLGDPARDEVPPDPIVAFARMYDPAGDDADEDAVDDALPEAPPAVLPSWRQPVTVTVLPPLPVLLVPLCAVLLCAAAPTPHPAVTAIASAAI
jgi:hypothetical protein